MPKIPTSKIRKQRHKSAVSPDKASVVSAAVSIPEHLYRTALKQATNKHDGNFSGYVRSLIRRDLSLA